MTGRAVNASLRERDENIAVNWWTYRARNYPGSKMPHHEAEDLVRELEPLVSTLSRDELLDLARKQKLLLNPAIRDPRKIEITIINQQEEGQTMKTGGKYAVAGAIVRQNLDRSVAETEEALKRAGLKAPKWYIYTLRSTVKKAKGASKPAKERKPKAAKPRRVKRRVVKKRKVAKAKAAAGRGFAAAIRQVEKEIAERTADLATLKQAAQVAKKYI